MKLAVSRMIYFTNIMKIMTEFYRDKLGLASIDSPIFHSDDGCRNRFPTAASFITINAMKNYETRKSTYLKFSAESKPGGGRTGLSLFVVY